MGTSPLDQESTPEARDDVSGDSANTLSRASAEVRAAFCLQSVPSLGLGLTVTMVVDLGRVFIDRVGTTTWCAHHIRGLS